MKDSAYPQYETVLHPVYYDPSTSTLQCYYLAVPMTSPVDPRLQTCWIVPPPYVSPFADSQHPVSNEPAPQPTMPSSTSNDPLLHRNAALASMPSLLDLDTSIVQQTYVPPENGQLQLHYDYSFYDSYSAADAHNFYEYGAANLSYGFYGWDAQPTWTAYGDPAYPCATWASQPPLTPFDDIFPTTYAPLVQQHPLTYAHSFGAPGVERMPAESQDARGHPMIIRVPKDNEELAQLPSQEFMRLAVSGWGERLLKNRYIDKPGAREVIHSQLFKPGILLEASKHYRGNYLVQTVIMRGREDIDAIETLCGQLANHWLELAKDTYGTRVVQSAVRYLPMANVRVIAQAFRGHEKSLSLHHDASHIVIALAGRHDVSMMQPFVDAFRRKRVLRELLTKKHSNHVVFMIIKLLIDARAPVAMRHWRDDAVLREILSPIIERAHEYAMHAHANHVLQALLECPEIPELRHEIIQEGIMQLSMTKYGSHAVEKAMRCASSEQLAEMCAEIAHTGRWSNSEPRRDAVEVLAFDQYGNYVLQTLLRIHVETLRGERDEQLYLLDRIGVKLRVHARRLRERSSGCRILELIDDVHEEQQRQCRTSARGGGAAQQGAGRGSFPL